MAAIAIDRPRDPSASGAAADRLFIIGEAKKGTKQIGFIPAAGVDQAMRENRALVMRREGDRVGFVIFGRSATSIKIYQIWVRSDARLIEHGKRLIDELESIAAANYKQRLRCWCLSHLEAMLFWHAMGFVQKGSRPGGKWARSPHCLWVRELPGVTRLLF